MKTDKELIKWALEESPEPIIKNPFLKLASLKSKFTGAPYMEVLPEEFDELSPREDEYYKQEPFSTREDFLGAKGGVAQLVQPGQPGVRQGYARPGGNPEFGKTITGTLHKGTVQAKTQPKLDFLKELIDRENSLYRKNKTIAELLNEAGWKGGWDSVPTSGETRKLIHKYNKKLLTTQQKMDNYVNNVMLAEDALVKDFRNPKQHLAKKFGVSKSFMDKWSSPDYYNSKVWAENKKLFTGLSNEFSFNKYKLLPDGTPRLMHDYSVIKYNQLPYTQGLHSGSSREKFILESAHRHNKYAKHAGIDSQITFINKNYELLPMNQWQFIKDGKLYSLDPSIDNVEFRGQTYKNNYLNRVDAAKLYKKDFGKVYKVFDELDVYMDTEVINPKTGKPIKLDKLLQERAHKLTGKKGYYKRRFMDIDHADIMKNPFGELRLLDATTNKRAGIIKRLEKYRNNPELLKKTLDDIGYNRKFNNTDELIKFYSKEAGVVPKFKPKISGGAALHSFPANIPAMWKKLGSGTRKFLGWATAGYAEKVFYDWDKKNEMSKGKTEEEAAAIALNNATFGIIPNKKYLPELKKVAEDMGIDSRAFEKVYFLNEKMAKVQKEDAQYQQKIEMIEKMPGNPARKAKALADMKAAYSNWQKGMTSQVEKWSEDVAGQIAISKTKLPKPSLDQIAEERYNITDEDWQRPFAEIQMVGEEKLRREKKRAFPVQSKLADPESGEKYKWITNWFTPTESFLDRRTTGQEKQRLIDDMVEKGEPGELYRYNIARGLDPDSPVTKEALENLQYEQPGLGLGMAGGGIANVRRPNAIPPESGPMPQGGGLSTMFNRVKPW